MKHMINSVVQAIALTASLAVVGCGPQSRLMGFNPAVQRQYDQLATGTMKGEVLAKLGQPDLTHPTFCLPQYEGFEKEFAKTNGITVSVFYRWHNGNWFYCIGFDKEDKVVVKGQGHS
jgi:hypothetical protein